MSPAKEEQEDSHEQEHSQEHGHSGSNDSEELDRDHHDDDSDHLDSIGIEELKASIEELQEQQEEDAHGDVRLKGNLNKEGYGPVVQTQSNDDSMREETKTYSFYDVPNPLNSQLHPRQMDMSQFKNFSQMSIEMQQKLMEQMRNVSQKNLIDVTKSWLEGNFKPFIAWVQLGYISSDFIVDAQIGRRVIHLVAHFGNMKALRVLNEIFKVDLSVKDYQGLNPVHYAAGSGEIETLKYIWEHVDEKVIEEKDMGGMTPLMHTASKNSVIWFIYLFCQRKCNIRSIDSKGCNILHWAAYSGSLPILKILEQVGILNEYKDKQDDLKQTPIIKSFFNKNIDAMKVLMKANWNLYIRDSYSNTPEEFIIRFLQDQKLYEVFLRYKYKQFLNSTINFQEVRNGCQKNAVFLSELRNFYYSKYSNILPHFLYGMLIFLMIFIHWYWSVKAGESSIILAFIKLFLIAASLVTYIMFLRSEVQVIPKRELEDDGSIVQEILKNIENWEFLKIVPLKEVWFNTNIRKIKHAEYCEDSDSYVIEYQKFWDFFQKPIGAGNASFYLIWLTANLILIGFFNLNIIWLFWGQSEVIFYYRIWDWIYQLFHHSFFLLFLPFLIVQFSFLVFFQNWIWMIHSVGRRQTINETKNSQNYRYVYKRVLDKETRNYLYIHRYFGLKDMAKNIWLFILNKHRTLNLNPAESGHLEDFRFSNASMVSVNTSEERTDSTFE